MTQGNGAAAGGDAEQSAFDHSADHAVIEAQQHVGITQWVAKQLSGKVVSIERLERWRPQWKVVYRVGGLVCCAGECYVCVSVCVRVVVCLY